MFHKRGLSFKTTKTKIFLYLGCRYITKVLATNRRQFSAEFIRTIKERSSIACTVTWTQNKHNCNIWCQSNHYVKWHVYFYPSELLKHDWQGRPRDKFIYKTFENSKLCPMAATNEYLKCRAEYNVAHTKFLFTTVSHYGPPYKETIARWVKIHLRKQEWIQTFFHLIVGDHLPAVRPIIWAWILIPC